MAEAPPLEPVYCRLILGSNYAAGRLYLKHIKDGARPVWIFNGRGHQAQRIQILFGESSALLAYTKQKERYSHDADVRQSREPCSRLQRLTIITYPLVLQLCPNTIAHLTYQ
jgi:hypothetical protein